MKVLISILGLLWIAVGCNTTKEAKHSNQLINNSVSPRAEKRFEFNSRGSQSFSGTNSDDRFDRSIAETRLNKKADADTLQKEFATNGKSINTKSFACEVYSTDERKPDIEASSQ